MTKKKLMVVVGAGASIDFGMPSVKAVDDLFCEWAKHNYQLADNKNASLYSYVRDAIESYYRLKEIRYRLYRFKKIRYRFKKRRVEAFDRIKKKKSKAYTNFEEVVYILLQLSKMVTGRSYSFPINAFLEMRNFPQIIHYGKETPVNGFHFSELESYLVDKLLQHFRSLCGTIDLKSEKFTRFSGFIQRLNSDFNTVFISVNYDNLITQAYPNLFTGFNRNGIFDAPEFYNHGPFDRSPSGSIYHLHGSVHFNMVATDDHLHTVTWNNDFKKESQNSAGRNYEETTEGITFLTSSIIAGLGKSHQIQRAPFRNYYSALDRLALDADAFLFLGYGFADEHLNSCFHSVPNSVKPVVVVDYASENKDTLSCGRNDPWSCNLSKLFRYRQGTCVSMNEIKKNGDSGDILGLETLQTKQGNHLSVFYNGFLETLSCENSVNTIIDRLGGTV